MRPIIFLKSIIMVILCLALFFSFEKTSIYALSNDRIDIYDISIYSNFSTENFTDFVIASEDTYFFLDPINHNITKWNPDDVTSYSSYGYNPGELYNPKQITYLQNNNFIIYDDFFRLQYFDYDFNLLRSFNAIHDNDDNSFRPFTTISSVTNDLSNTFYAIDYSTNSIIKLDTNMHYNDMRIEDYIDADALGLSFTEDTKIVSSTSGTSLYVYNTLNSTNIYKITSKSELTVIDVLSNGITSVDDISIDYTNNLFILENNTGSSKIHKLSRSTYLHEKSVYDDSGSLSGANKLRINIETGKIILINNSEHRLQYVNTSSIDYTFTENVESYQHPIDIIEAAALTSKVNILSTNKENTKLLSTPFTINTDIVLDVGTKILQLSDNIIDNPNFYYVLYSSEKGIIPGYILKTQADLVSYNERENEQVKTLNTTTIYKYPNSGTIENKNLSIESIQKNSYLELSRFLYNYTDSNGYKYYEVKLDEYSFGYIREIDVVTCSNQYITKTMTPNSMIRIYNEIETILVYENPDTSSKSYYSLSNNDKIYISDYDINNEFTFINFIDDGGQIVSGYVRTEYIFMYTDSNSYIRAFSLIGLNSVLLLMVILYKHKKRSA